MPHDPAQRYAPMVNIQQYYVEEYAHQAMQRHPDLARISWSSRVLDVQNKADGVRVQVQANGATHWIEAQGLVAFEIGRASWGDSVCQSEVILVVAVTFKKKKT